MRYFLYFLLIVIVVYSQTTNEKLDYANYYNHGELFNEKSLSKSNSYFKNGNINISDFSGNLTYTYPVHQKKMGPLSALNISMVYNSGLSAQSLNSFFTLGYFKLMGTNSNSRPLTSGFGHISVPGWILNVNGVAVQLLNYENLFYTKAKEQPNYSGITDHCEPTKADSVNRVFRGWHYNFVYEDRPDPASSNGSSKEIYQVDVLSGDGSIYTFRFNQALTNTERALNDQSDRSKYILYDLNKSGILASLQNDKSRSDNKFTHLKLEHPDGKVVIYKIWYGMTIDNQDLQWAGVKQASLVPEQIQFRDKRSITFFYDNDKRYLMPNLYRILVNAVTNIYVKQSDSFIQLSMADGKNYVFNYQQKTEPGQYKNNHGLISEIIDPEKQRIKLQYEDYSVTQYGLWAESSDATNFGYRKATHVIHNLKRISRIQNNNGEKHYFNYLDPKLFPSDPIISKPHGMLIGDYSGTNPNFRSYSKYYEMTGREAYNTNIVSRYTVKNEQEQVKKQNHYYYAYHINGGGNHFFHNKYKIYTKTEDFFSTLVLSFDSDKVYNGLYINSFNKSFSPSSYDYDSFQANLETAIGTGLANLAKEKQYMVYKKYNSVMNQPERLIVGTAENSSQYKMLYDNHKYRASGQDYLSAENHYRYEKGNFELDQRTYAPDTDTLFFGSLDLTEKRTLNYKKNQNSNPRESWEKSNVTYHKVMENNTQKTPIYRYPLQRFSENSLGVKKTVKYENGTYKDDLNEILYSPSIQNNYRRSKYSEEALTIGTTTMETKSVQDYHILNELYSSSTFEEADIQFKYSNGSPVTINNGNAKAAIKESNVYLNDLSSRISREVAPYLPPKGNEVYDLLRQFGYDISQWIIFKEQDWQIAEEYVDVNDDDKDGNTTEWLTRYLPLHYPDGKPEFPGYWLVQVPSEANYNRVREFTAGTSVATKDQYEVKNPVGEVIDGTIIKTTVGYRHDMSSKNGVRQDYWHPYVLKIYKFPSIQRQITMKRGLIFKPVLSTSATSYQFNYQFLKNYFFDYQSDQKLKLNVYLLDQSSYRNLVNNYQRPASTSSTLNINNASEIQVQSLQFTSTSDLDNIKNYGLFIFPDDTDTDSYDFHLKDNFTSSNNLADFSLLNTNAVNYSDITNQLTYQNSHYTAGLPIASYTFKKLNENGTIKSYLMMNGLFKYQKDLQLEKLVDAKNNVTKFSNESFTKNYSYFHNNTAAATESHKFPYTGAMPVTMTKVLPGNQEISYHVKQDLYTDNILAVANHYDNIVRYTYDKNDRIKSIFLPNTQMASATVSRTSASELDDITKKLYRNVSDDQNSNFYTEINKNLKSRVGYIKEWYIKKPGNTVVEELMSQCILIPLKTDFLSSFNSVTDIELLLTVEKPETHSKTMTVGIASQYPRPANLLETFFRTLDSSYPATTISTAGNYTLNIKNAVDYNVNNPSSEEKSLVISLSSNNNLQSTEYFNISSIKFKVTGERTFSTESEDIIYNYDIANRKITVFNSNGYNSITEERYDKMKSEFTYDAHHRLLNSKKYKNTSGTGNDYLALTNSYGYNDLLLSSLDNEKKTVFTYDRFYEKTKSSVKNLSESISLNTESDYLYITKASFLSELSNYGLNYEGTLYYQSLPMSRHYKKITGKDENQNEQISYISPDGKKLAEIKAGNSEYIITAYEYDDTGNLLRVVHPNAVKADKTVNPLLCTVYSYDKLYGFLRTKKLPDQAEIKYAYDHFGRLRFSQDGKQRSSGHFMYSYYDKMDRVLYSGISDESLKTFNSLYARGHHLNKSSESFESNANHLLFNVYDSEPLFLSNSIFTDFNNQNLPKTSLSYMLGDLSYSASRADNQSSWNYNWSEKDRFGRIITSNKYENGFLIRENYYYDLMNRLITKTIISPHLSQNYAYKYDELGRLRELHKDGTLLISYQYDLHDRVVNHKLINDKLSTQFNYNFLGWLTDINDISNDNAFFSLKLDYWQNALSGGQVNYNGNISSMRYKHKGEAQEGMVYDYDRYNRLLKSRSINALNQLNYQFGSSYSYDKAGNILKLSRKGIK